MNGDFADAGQQILQSLGMQRKIYRVNVFAPEGRIHDCRRERVRHRISSYTIDTRGRVDLLDTINAAQILCADLSGSGFLAGTDRSKSKDAARAHSQHAADDSLFSHAHADNRILIPLAPQELDHGNIVKKRSGRTHDLIKIGWVGTHLFQRFVELLGTTKVMKRKD